MLPQLTAGREGPERFQHPSGEGSTRVDSQPTDEASCQTMTVPTGSSQGRGVTTGDGLILPSRSPQLCATLRGINSLATASPAGAGFAAAGWTAPRRQAGEQQLSDPVRLFQMRIAGKDKAIDTQRGVFIDPFGNGGGIAHQRGPGAAAR